MNYMENFGTDLPTCWCNSQLEHLSFRFGSSLSVVKRVSFKKRRDLRTVGTLAIEKETPTCVCGRRGWTCGLVSPSLEMSSNMFLSCLDDRVIEREREKK